jgi:hypothetical protein
MSEAAIDDKIANNRTLVITKPESIPAPDPRYQPTESDKRASRLKKVAKNLEAELIDALDECVKLGPEVKVLLGEYAPDGEKAAPISADLAMVRAALSRVYELAAYLEEKKMILLSDGRAYIDAIKREYDHHADRKSGLASTFRETVQFSKAIGDAISDGIAEAKKKT